MEKECDVGVTTKVNTVRLVVDSVELYFYS